MLVYKSTLLQILLKTVVIFICRGGESRGDSSEEDNLARVR